MEEYIFFMIQFGDPEENTNLDNDNQHAFGLPKDKMGGAYNVAEFFNASI